MPKTVRRKSQAKFERRALKKLRVLGLYTGKIDLRKTPTPYQRKQITKFSDVVAGKAAVVEPKNPKSYAGLFTVKGDKVVIPKRKGEKIKVTPKGAIITERKIGKRTVRARFRKTERAEQIRREHKAMYAVPFIRGRDKNGRPVLEYKRFPNWTTLQKFMKGYDYKGWQKYVVVETIDGRIISGKRRRTEIPDDDEE